MRRLHIVYKFQTFYKDEDIIRDKSPNRAPPPECFNPFDAGVYFKPNCTRKIKISGVSKRFIVRGRDIHPKTFSPKFG